MKHLTKYSIIFYSLLLAGSSMIGEISRGLSPAQTQKENTVAYIPFISYDLFAVEPPGQSISQSLRLYPQSTFDYSPDSDAGTKTAFKSSLSQTKPALLYSRNAAVFNTYLRRLLFPFHSFL